MTDRKDQQRETPSQASQTKRTIHDRNSDLSSRDNEELLPYNGLDRDGLFRAPIGFRGSDGDGRGHGGRVQGQARFLGQATSSDGRGSDPKARRVKPEDVKVPEGMFWAFAKAFKPGTREERHRHKLAAALAWQENHRNPSATEIILDSIAKQTPLPMDKNLYDNPNDRRPDSAGRGSVIGLLIGLGMWLVVGLVWLLFNHGGAR